MTLAAFRLQHNSELARAGSVEEAGSLYKRERLPMTPPLTESVIAARLEGIEGDARGLREVLGDLGARLLNAPGLQDGGTHVIQGQHRRFLVGTASSADSKFFGD